MRNIDRHLEKEYQLWEKIQSQELANRRTPPPLP